MTYFSGVLANEPAPLGHLYRFESVRYSNGCDEWDNPYPGHTVGLTMHSYPILKKTPKGAWIASTRYLDFAQPNGRARMFILLTAKKQFACATKERALESFLARKRVMISIYNGRIADAGIAIELAIRKLKELGVKKDVEVQSGVPEGPNPLPLLGVGACGGVVGGGRDGGLHGCDHDDGHHPPPGCPEPVPMHGVRHGCEDGGDQ